MTFSKALQKKKIIKREKEDRTLLSYLICIDSGVRGLLRASRLARLVKSHSCKFITCFIYSFAPSKDTRVVRLLEGYVVFLWLP